MQKIVHWRNHLKFPEETRITPEAKALICRLLCDIDNRVGTGGADQIKAHPWFKDTQGDNLYDTEAAFKPKVTEEEKIVVPHDCLIHVYHFTKGAVQNQMDNCSRSFIY